jgi:hypothetical protein
VKEFAEFIRDKVDNFIPVSDQELNQLREMLNTGFHNWSMGEYQKFMKAIRKYDFKDIKAIAEVIETKTIEEV